MICEPSDKMEIQIENEAPFIPEKVIWAGLHCGVEEKTKTNDPVKSFSPSSKYAVIHYVFNGLEVENCYARGKWESGTNGLPRFHVYDLLRIQNEPNA